MKRYVVSWVAEVDFEVEVDACSPEQAVEIVSSGDLSDSSIYEVDSRIVAGSIEVEDAE